MKQSPSTSGVHNPYVIPKSELDRIKALVVPKEILVDHNLQMAKTLHEASVKRSQNLQGTIVGNRMAALKKKKDTLEKEELAKQELDKAEFEKRRELNRLMILQSKRVLRESSELYKTQMKDEMKSDIKRENEKFLQTKEKMEQLEKIREEEFKEMDKIDYQNKIERENRERRELEEKVAALSIIRAKQLEETKQKRIQEIQQYYREGDAIKQKAVEDLAIERLALEKKRQREVNARKDVVRANEYLIKMKELEKLEEAKELQKIQAYADKKEKFAELIAQKKEAIFNEQMKVRLDLIEKQAEGLRKIRDEENVRLNKEIIEKQVREERILQEKLEQQQKQKKMIDEQRQIQLEELRGQKLKELQENIQVKCETENAVRLLTYQEEMIENRKKQEALKLAQFHQHQMMAREAKEKRERKIDLENAMRAIVRANRVL